MTWFHRLFFLSFVHFRVFEILLKWSVLLGPTLSSSSSLFFIDLIISYTLITESGIPFDSFQVTRLWVISNLYFYSAGHTTTFSGIPFYATAVGFKSHSTQIVPFLMVLFNTYGSHIMSYLFATKWVFCWVFFWLMGIRP